MTENGREDTGCYTEHGVSGYGAAVKLSRRHPMDDAFIKLMAEKMMVTVAQKCMELGARCIGHIKSHLNTTAGTIKADTIGASHGAYSTGEVTRPVDTVYMAINSIVQGIPEDAVKAATLEGIHDIAEEMGITIVKEKEHTYFDEFDFTTSKQEYRRQLEAQLSAANPDDDGADE